MTDKHTPQSYKNTVHSSSRVGRLRAKNQRGDGFISVSMTLKRSNSLLSARRERHADSSKFHIAVLHRRFHSALVGNVLLKT